MTGRRKRGEGEDELAWWWATREIAPLPGKAKPARPAAKPEAEPVRRAPAPVRPKPAEPPPAKGSPGTLHAGKGAGIDRRTAQRLGRGFFPIEAEIDLHGMGRTQAHAELAAFLAASQRRERACVRIVTGHGQRGPERAGVLRELVPRWLNEPALRPRVLGFAVAQPRHGGNGAFYVLLRKRD